MPGWMSDAGGAMALAEGLRMYLAAAVGFLVGFVISGFLGGSR